MFINSWPSGHSITYFHCYFQQKQSASVSLDKIVSGYQVVYGSEVDEDVVLSKCRNSISYLEKLDKEIGADVSSGTFSLLYIADGLIFIMIFLVYEFSPVLL